MLNVFRKDYRVYQDELRPWVCVVEAETEEARAILRQQYEGWRITFDLLGPCAPLECRLISEDRLEREFVSGAALNHWYGLALTSSNGAHVRLPWDVLWQRLRAVWESGRAAPANSTFTVVTLWGTWFAIAELRKAKWQAVRNSWQRPLWSAEALGILLRGRWSGGYTAVPDVAFEIMERSRHGLLLGDMHFENLVGTENRLAFVDFSEVGRGPIAIDLAPLWLEWWLARGVLHGDDGFLPGFRELWAHYVGPESLLCQMTRQWVQRAFSWLVFAFYHFHLNLQHELALRYGRLARSLKMLLNNRDLEADTLDGLLYGSAKVFV